MKKKINKKFICYLLILVLYSISFVLFTISVIKLSGIETVIRIAVLALFLLFGIFYLIEGFICVANKKAKKLFIAISIGIGLIIPILFVGSVYINKTYNKLGSFNKEKITYTTNLVMLKENNSIENLGLIENVNDIEGYKLAKKLIEKEQLDNLKITYYEDYPTLITALYNKEVSGIFLSSNYQILFESEFETIGNDLKIKNSYSEELKKAESSLTSNKKLNEPFTILLIGVDGMGDTLNANQSFNGDTLMLITFNPHTLNATMFSIPRDTYVEIACRNNQKAKINTSAYYGTSCVVDTIEKLTDIEIDYYVKMNFKGLVNLVDALGGIDVNVPYAFCEQNSNRQWGKQTVYVEAGNQHLNGEQALALSRNRHTWSSYCASKWTLGTRNDFVRGQNQQLVVTGIGKSIKNVNSIKDFYNIFDVIANTIDTNLSENQILSFYEVAKDILIRLTTTNDDFINIEKTYLMTYNQMINNRSMEIYYENSLSEIIEAMKVNLEIEEPKLITTFDFSINTSYEKKVIGKNTTGGISLEKTMPNFIGQSQNYVNSWAKENNISVQYIDVTKEDSLYKESYNDGYIVSQSPKKTSLLKSNAKISIYVIKKEKNQIKEESQNNDIDQNIQDLLE